MNSEFKTLPFTLHLLVQRSTPKGITCCVLRADKYSSKVYKYFVEYSDTESTSKSYTEIEKRVSTENEAV